MDTPPDRVTLAALIDVFSVTVQRERDRADRAEAEARLAGEARMVAEAQAIRAEEAAAAAQGRVAELEAAERDRLALGLSHRLWRALRRR